MKRNTMANARDLLATARPATETATAAKVTPIQPEAPTVPITVEPETPIEAKPRRRRITLYIDESLYSQARSAVHDLDGSGIEPRTVTAFINSAMRHELERLSDQYREGEPWKPRGALPGGRPQGTRVQ